MALHHVRRGAGEPLLLIQGMSGNHLHWGEPFLELLEHDFDVVAFDHRGVGKSPRTEAAFSIRDLADDAAGVLDDAGFETAHVVGISMGGMVAQELALNHPARLRSLTLGCTYCGGPGQRLTPPDVVALLTEAVLSGDRDRAIRTGFEINLSGAHREQPDAFERFRETAVQLPAPVAVTLLQAQAAAAHDTSARLHEIRVPTLVIHGDADRMLPVGNAAQIAALIPGARLEILPAAGHMFWWEEPERSARLVAEHALGVRQ
jgi:pimeloyl-ACP methyl ester carboxylesterase